MSASALRLSCAGETAAEAAGAIKEQFMKTIFSTVGRIGRGTYAMRLLLITAGTFAASLAAGAALGIAGAITNREVHHLVNTVAMLIGLSGMVLTALQAGKRLHDLGRSAGHYFLLWVPIYNIYLTLELLFRKGKETPNQYGDDPTAVTRLDLGVAA
jgi:uncharacterized membrane protein YhaH (DUF805 family)